MVVVSRPLDLLLDINDESESDDERNIWTCSARFLLLFMMDINNQLVIMIVPEYDEL